jgi:hypothetical protein
MKNKDKLVEEVMKEVITHEKYGLTYPIDSKMVTDVVELAIQKTRAECEKEIGGLREAVVETVEEGAECCVLAQRRERNRILTDLKKKIEMMKWGDVVQSDCGIHDSALDDVLKLIDKETGK